MYLLFVMRKKLKGKFAAIKMQLTFSLVYINVSNKINDYCFKKYYVNVEKILEFKNLFKMAPIAN